jgi:serine/threonine protein kinase, bacterial
MPKDAGEGLQEGELFAGYTIVRRLGAGGMGEVYLADHPRLPRRDALKILPAAFTANQEFRQRFNREADLAGSLYNEHIVGIHDRGEYHGQLWISMDYVEGTDAAHLLNDQHPTGMALPDVLEIVSAVADALDYAHTRGLLHRDVKPANILLGHPNPRRRILLADFGIARQLDDAGGLTATNMLMGTTAYCAPEQLQGSDLDGRVDQYALGCTAYQLLTGGAPFHNSNPAVVITQHLSAPPPSLSMRRPELAYLDTVIAKALAKDRAERYPTCADFAAALGAPPGPAPMPGPTVAMNAPMAMSAPTQVIIPTPQPAVRGSGHGILITLVVVGVLVATAVVLGVVVMEHHRGNKSAGATSSTQPGSSSTSSSESVRPARPAFKLTEQVTDVANVLGPAEHLAVDRAVKKLYDARGTRLWVVYLVDFGGFKPAAWAETTMRANDFTDSDALLAITTEPPDFGFHVPAAVTDGRPIDVEQIRRDRIKPAVERREWTRAALAAANGLDVGPR